MHTTTTTLIDAYMKRHALRNDRQAAKKLGMAEGSVYRYRRGTTMDDAIAIKICNDIGIDPAPTLAKMVADRTINKKTKDFWNTIAKRLTTTAASIIIGSSMISGVYAPSNTENSPIFEFAPITIMRTIQLWEWLKTLLVMSLYKTLLINNKKYTYELSTG